jgi:hypothetical protein
MTIKLKKFDNDEPQSGRATNASSAEPGMIVGDVQSADIRSTVTPDRRLRNWIMLANVLAWIVIIVAVRWLFF